MSLLHCPECGHEVSANAVACPNCGRPLAPAPLVDEKVVVVQRRESGFPNWAFIPIVLLGLILLFVVYLVFRQTDDQANTNVNLAARRQAEANRETHNVTVPPTSESQPITAPGSTTTVPGTATSVPVPPPSDKGTVVLNAKIASPRGSAQPARNAKFYLLDRDLKTILSEARLEPIEGNTLSGSLGLAVAFPDRYGGFQLDAMHAIGAHVKYSATTGGGGSANLAGVVPGEYYLFSILRVGRGFALWDAPVSVVPGQNIMNLSPQSVTEIPESTG